MKTTLLMFIALAAATCACGQELRISFLDTPLSLSNALSFLSLRNCSTSGVVAVRSAVEQFYAETNSFDTSKFPPRVNDEYVFPSVRDALAAFRNHPAQGRHAYGMNCFDFVTLLLDGELDAGLQPDECEPIFLAPYNSNETQVSFEPMPTPRSAFMLAYPADYRDMMASLTRTPYSDKRIVLTACIDSCTPFPRVLGRSPKEWASSATAFLHGRWLGQKFKIPDDSPLVLKHEARLDSGFMCTTHAGLLYRAGEKYVYFAKSGGRGPFIRIDFGDRKQLAEFERGLCQFDDARTKKIYFLGIGNGPLEQIYPNVESVPGAAVK